MTVLACHSIDATERGGVDWPTVATIGTAVLAALVALVGYIIQRKITRRSERADLYARALGAVEDYLEGPYRIRRKTKDPNNWSAISSALSDCKSAVSHHKALLQLHAPSDVAAGYDAFVSAAELEAGPIMTQAWAIPPLEDPRDVPLGARYSRTQSDLKRAELVDEMSKDLNEIGTWWRLRT